MPAESNQSVARPRGDSPNKERGFMTNRRDLHTNDNTDAVTNEHLSEETQRSYVAALLAGAARDPEWAYATEHLANCPQCLEGALRGAHELWDSPRWRLLEPGEFARRAQQLWINRLREHPEAPKREAAAYELGALEPLGGAGFAALLEAAERDPDQEVREAAIAALADAHARKPLAARLEMFEATADIPSPA
jgi:hypothetical protein